MVTPKQDYSDSRADSVNDDIMYRCLSRRHEELMEFICARIESDAGNGNASFAPAPRAGIVPLRFPQRPPEQKRHDGVLCEMRAFACEQHDEINSVLGDVRKEPMQQRRNDPRGMLVGPGVTRCGERHRHPENHWKPVDEERPEF